MARRTTRLENHCCAKTSVEFYEHVAYVVSRVGRACVPHGGVWRVGPGFRVTFWKTLTIASGRRHTFRTSIQFSVSYVIATLTMDYGWIDSRSDLLKFLCWISIQDQGSDIEETELRRDDWGGNHAVDKLLMSESQPRFRTRSSHRPHSMIVEKSSISSCDLIHVLYEIRIINVGLRSGMLLEQ